MFLDTVLYHSSYTCLNIIRQLHRCCFFSPLMLSVTSSYLSLSSLSLRALSWLLSFHHFLFLPNYVFFRSNHFSYQHQSLQSTCILNSSPLSLGLASPFLSLCHSLRFDFSFSLLILMLWFLFLNFYLICNWCLDLVLILYWSDSILVIGCFYIVVRVDLVFFFCNLGFVNFTWIDSMDWFLTKLGRSG